MCMAVAESLDESPVICCDAPVPWPYLVHDLLAMFSHLLGGLRTSACDPAMLQSSKHSKRACLPLSWTGHGQYMAKRRPTCREYVPTRLLRLSETSGTLVLREKRLFGPS